MTDEDTEGEKLTTEEERESELGSVPRNCRGDHVPQDSNLGSDTEELPRRLCPIKPGMNQRFMAERESLRYGDFASLVILHQYSKALDPTPECISVNS